MVGWDWNGWGVRCVTDCMMGSIVLLGRFVGWLLVIEGLRSCFVGGVRVLRCEVGRGGLKRFTSINPIKMLSMS